MDGGGQVLQQVIFFGLLILGLYLLVIRPQRSRARALAEVRGALAVGSRVITTAGLYGTVTGLEDGDVVLEIAPGVQARFVRAAVVQVLNPARPQPDEPPAGDAE